MTREQARERAQDLVNKMTIEEMASQLRYDAPGIERLGIPAYNWWSEALHGMARAGAATVFPQAIGLAAAFDTELMREIGDAVSTEARAKYNASVKNGDRGIYKGLTVWSPNVNIFRDPRWGRGHETFGEDPYLTGRLGVSYIKGLQGDGKYLKTAACAKHFAVHSGPEKKRHYFDAKVSRKELCETYLPAFEACVKEAGVEAVMGAYNRTNGEPCCASPTLISEILRGKWGFEGHYVSDCWAIRDFHENHNVTKNPRESAALALNNGCDLNCGCTYLCIVQAYNEKKITKEQLQTACVRLFTTRFLLGLFDENCEYNEIPYTEIESPAHIALSRRAAQESTVLLKNEGFLPLDKKEIRAKRRTIGIIGPNANSRAALIGNYHGTPSFYTTIAEGIRSAVIHGEPGENEQSGEVRVLCSEGCHLYKEKVEPLAEENDRISEALAVAENSEIIVLVTGLDETLEGEEGDTGNSYASGDKTDLELPKSQRILMDSLIEYCNREKKPMVLVNMTGSAMNLRKAIDADCVKAILQAWYPGAEGGKALANILFGKVSPSGKLPVTFYETSEELPDFDDYSMKGRTYRFMKQKAQYPFGYGLTYGKVRVVSAGFLKGEEEKLQKDLAEAENGRKDRSFENETRAEKRIKDFVVPKLEENWYNINVEVKNEGSAATGEVLEAYIKKENGKSLPSGEKTGEQSGDGLENYSLCGFERIFVPAGETVQAVIKIPGKAFLSYDEDGERVLSAEGFKIYVGTCGPDERSVELTGTEPILIELGGLGCFI